MTRKGKQAGVGAGMLGSGGLRAARGLGQPRRAGTPVRAGSVRRQVASKTVAARPTFLI